MFFKFGLCDFSMKNQTKPSCEPPYTTLVFHGRRFGDLSHPRTCILSFLALSTLIKDSIFLNLGVRGGFDIVDTPLLLNYKSILYNKNEIIISLFTLILILSTHLPFLSHHSLTTWNLHFTHSFSRSQTIVCHSLTTTTHDTPHWYRRLASRHDAAHPGSCMPPLAHHTTINSES